MHRLSLPRRVFARVRAWLNRALAPCRLGHWFGWWLVVTGVVLLAVLLLGASSARASSGPVQVVALAGSVNEVLTNIRNWIMGILAGLATVFLTVGGLRYVMAGGDPGEVEKAKAAFKSAGWGYGMAALAPLIVEILKGIVGT